MNTMNKIRIVVTSIIVIFLIVIVSLLFRIKNSVVMNDTENSLIQNANDNKILDMNEDYTQIIREVAKQNGNWKNLPLSENFKKKYKQKNGILNDNKITYLSVRSGNVNDKEKQIVVLIVEHNAKNEDYYIHYIVNDQNELDDVEIVDKKLLYDEEGNEVIYKVSMDEKNYDFNITRLAFPFGADRDPRDYINITDNYIKNYFDGFIRIENADRISTLPLSKISSYDDKIVYLEVEYCMYKDENDDIGDWYGPMYYKVEYVTDDKLWLDDVKVEEVSKEEIDRLLEENGK